MTLLKPLLRYEMLLVEFLLAYGTCKGFYPQHSAYFSAETRPFNDGLNQILLNDAFPLRKPFEELCKALESAPDHLPNKRRKPHPKSRASEHPLVVLAFDEVHTLTKPEDNGSWSRFGEMRRAIRGLRTLSLFTLFLSTSVTLFGTIPTPVPDVSARMLIESDDILPFCELGFDMFAKHLDFGKPVTLSHVTSEEHLTSYGRPLCVLNDHPVSPQLTFALDSPLNTGRDSRTHYSALQPRSCWVALHIIVSLSQMRKSWGVSLSEFLSNFSPPRMLRKYQTWKRSKSIPTCGSFSRLIIGLRPWSLRRLLNRCFQRRHTS